MNRLRARLRTFFTRWRRRWDSDSGPLQPRLKVVTLSLPKSDKPADRNQDAVAIRHADDTSFRVALADGVSRSHQPRHWARHVVDFAVATEHSTLNQIETLALAAATFNEGLEKSEDWLEQELQQRGSACTLVALSAECPSAGEWQLDLHVIGDSVAFVFEDGRPARWLPPIPADSFSNVTDALCTTQPIIRGRFLTTSELVRSGSSVCVVSDALASFAVRKLEEDGHLTVNEVFPFLSDPSGDEFEDWVVSSRLNKTLDDDDSTLVLVRLP